MTDISNNVGEKPIDDFNALSFERKLVELVEELRLRRNLEVESEKTLKSVMDEKYQEELSWDEKLRRHGREREDFAQQIDLLKRKLEDKVCVSDEDKAKQQIMNKTYSHEIRILKEELRVSKSEKLNLQKKIQELEIKLKLHDNFQESILNQVSEVRKMMKAIFEENKELMGSQKKMLENVASAKYMFKKYDLCNQHLTQCIEVIGKKNESLKKKLISSWSENTLLKQSVPTTKEKNNNYLEVEKWQKKVLDLENLLLTSRKENENTLSNFLESNKLLCKFVDKFSEIEEREKQLTVELELLQNKFRATQDELQKTKDMIKEIEDKTALKEKKRIENQCSAGIQTESVLDYSCSCSKTFVKSSDNEVTTTLASFMPKEMDKNFMDEFRNGLVNLQQNALMMQSEMSVNNGIHSFSLDQLCVNSADKKITLSQVLKRKLEIMESGDPIEKIMKKRFTENTSQSVIVVDNGVERDIKNEMLISHATNSRPLYGKLNQDIPYLSSSVKNEMLISHETNSMPLYGKLNQDIPYLSSGVKPKMLIPHEPNDLPLCDKFNQDIPCLSSSVKPKMLISHEPNGLPLCGKFNQDIPYLASSVKPKMLLSYETNGQPLNRDVSVHPPSVDIHLDQRYLTYKKFPGKVNDDDDDDCN